MIKDFFKNKVNQKDVNMPTYVLIFMACYVIWQMGIIWLDANNSILDSAINLSHEFFNNLATICVIVSFIAITILIIKPKYAFKLCKLSTIISLLTTIVLLTNNFVGQCLYILVATCSIMSISSLAIYFYTYNSSNLRKQVLFEMLGTGIISLIFHNDLFKMSSTIYYVVSLILLILFIIGLNKITEIDIKLTTFPQKENNKSFYLGITLLILLFHIAITFGANIVIQIKNGITLFYVGHIAGALLYFLLGKSKIKKSYIPSIYIAIFIVALAIIYVTKINVLSSFLLGIANSAYFILPYYCNLTFKNYLSKAIYIIYNLTGVLQVVLMDFILSLTGNNLNSLISVYATIAIISLGVLFIINHDVSNKIDKMLKKEKKESLFLDLSESEKNIAELMIKNYSNSEIAESVFLSPNTIKFHIKNIFRKLNINSRKELIKLFDE